MLISIFITKGLLQTVYWPKLLLPGDSALLGVLNVWISLAKLWITFCFAVSSWSCPFFLLVCESSNRAWIPSAAAESDHSQTRLGEVMLKFTWFRQSSTTSEFLTDVKRFVQPQKAAQNNFSPHFGFIWRAVALMGLTHELGSAAHPWPGSSG